MCNETIDSRDKAGSARHTNWVLNKSVLKASTSLSQLLDVRRDRLGMAIFPTLYIDIEVVRQDHQHVLFTRRCGSTWRYRRRWETMTTGTAGFPGALIHRTPRFAFGRWRRRRSWRRSWFRRRRRRWRRPTAHSAIFANGPIAVVIFAPAAASRLLSNLLRGIYLFFTRNVHYHSRFLMFLQDRPPRRMGANIGTGGFSLVAGFFCCAEDG